MIDNAYKTLVLAINYSQSYPTIDEVRGLLDRATEAGVNGRTHVVTTDKHMSIEEGVEDDLDG